MYCLSVIRLMSFVPFCLLFARDATSTECTMHILQCSTVDVRRIFCIPSLTLFSFHVLVLVCVCVYAYACKYVLCVYVSVIAFVVFLASCSTWRLHSLAFTCNESAYVGWWCGNHVYNEYIHLVLVSTFLSSRWSDENSLSVALSLWYDGRER